MPKLAARPIILISQNSIQQILSRIDIIDVIGGFVKLKKEAPITSAFALFIMKELRLSRFLLPKKSINVLVVAKVGTP